MPDNDQESKNKTNRNTIEIVLFLIGFVGIFIPTIIWWSRLHPWFSHGEKDGKSVYQSLFACWILSLIGVALSAFLLISNICLTSICERIVERYSILWLVMIAELCLSIGSIVSGAYASSYALKNPKFGEGRDDNKCMKYLSYGFTGASLWASKNNKIDDFIEWSTKLAKHSQNDDDTYNGYLCRDVGASTLTFVIVLCIAVMYSIIQLCKAICLGAIYG